MAHLFALECRSNDAPRKDDHGGYKKMGGHQACFRAMMHSIVAIFMKIWICCSMVHDTGSQLTSNYTMKVHLY